jgi:hypothetical protein
MRMNITRASAVCLVTALLATGRPLSGAAASDEFYTLASAREVAVREGSAVRLTANGPVAFATVPDTAVPPGTQRIRVRLYGVDRYEGGTIGTVGSASVTATPDGRGNLDVVVTATVPLDSAGPFAVRNGGNPNEVDVVMLAATP